MSNTIQFRSLGRIERAEGDESRRISGQAIVFDSWSRDLGGFIERILPGAVTEDLLLNSDVVMNVNHDNDQMLARSVNGEGTLSLELREDGVWFSFDAPETERGNELLYNVRVGNLYECSFACTILKDDIKRYREGDVYVQEITRINSLHDVSIVTHAAYAATSVFARSEEEAKAEFEEIKSEVDIAEAAARAAAIAAEEVKQEEARQAAVLAELESLREQFLSEIS